MFDKIVDIKQASQNNLSCLPRENPTHTKISDIMRGRLRKEDFFNKKARKRRKKGCFFVMIKFLKTFVSENKIVLFLLYWPFYLVTFFTLDKMELPRYLIECRWDSLIPFNEYFSLIYLFWVPWFSGISFFFLYVALKPWLKGHFPLFFKKHAKLSRIGCPKVYADYRLKEFEENEARLAKADYIKLSTVMFTGMSVCLITYVVWPNMINLREPITGHNLFTVIVTLLRIFDTPYNVCPSIHIVTIISEALVISFSRLKVFTTRAKFEVWIITILIAYSTLAIKQHSVVDVMVGIGVSLILYMMFMLGEYFIVQKKKRSLPW